MKRKRPAAVLVTGILNILAGCLSLLCGFGIAGIGSLGSVGVAALAAKETPFSSAVQEQLQYYFLIDTFQGFAVLAFGVLLIVAGIGLLCMGGWARWLSIGLGALLLADWVGYTVIQDQGKVPVVYRWEAEKARAEGRTLPGSPAFFRTVSGLETAVETGPFIAYAAVLLLMMSLPHVAGALSRRPAPEPEEEGPDPHDRDAGRPPDEGGDRSE
jgi:hypothetical protein